MIKKSSSEETEKTETETKKRKERLKAEGLAAVSRLKVKGNSIDLRGSGVSGDIAKDLKAILLYQAEAVPSEMQKIRRIQLGNNCLGLSGLQVLSQGLSAPGHALLELDLSYNSLGPKGIEMLSQALVVYNCLERLNLAGNASLHYGAIALCKSVYQDTTSKKQYLKQLNFAHNKIGDHGAQVFASVQLGGPAMTALNLRENAITPQGIAAIANAIEQSPKTNALTALDLRDNIYSLEAFWALAEALEKKKKSFLQQEHQRQQDFMRLPPKERWRIIADAKGFTQQQIQQYEHALKAQASQHLQRQETQDRQARLTNLLTKTTGLLGSTASLGLESLRSSALEDDDREGRLHEQKYPSQKANDFISRFQREVISQVPDRYIPREFHQQLFLYGLPVRPRPLLSKLIDHHSTPTSICLIM